MEGSVYEGDSLKDKTITQQFEDIKEDICNHYCHYPYIWDEEKDGELSESEICKNCPLNKL